MVVGTRLNYVMGFGRPPRFAEAARWIRIDIDPEEIAGRPVDVGIVGDARTVLRQLGESLDGRIDPKRYEGWRTRLAAINREKQSAQEARLSNDQVPIHPLRLCTEVRDFMDRSEEHTSEIQSLMRIS